MDPVPASQVGPIAVVAIESWVLVARALFVVAGTLVASNSVEIMIASMRLRYAMRGQAAEDVARALDALGEQPPYSPFRNALAWLIISVSGIIGAMFFIYGGQITYGRQDGLTSQFGVFVIWTGLATGVVFRAADRSVKPRLIWRACAIFGVAGFALTMGEALL